MVEYKVLKCMFEENYDNLLKQFGIDRNKAVFEVERFLGRKLNRHQDNQQQVQQKPVQNSMMQSNLPSMTAEGAADFFSQLGQNQNQPPKQERQAEGPSALSLASQASDDQQRPQARSTVQETISRNNNWDEGAEGIIKQNLLIGELEYAAQVALKCGRTTEALLIAESGGEELYQDWIVLYNWWLRGVC